MKLDSCLRLLPLFALLCTVTALNTFAGGGQEKVTICHIPPGNPANAQTITVSARAVAAHLAHGDSLGPCDEGCASDADCDDNNVCTVDTCDQSTGDCTNAPIADGCLSDADCEDVEFCDSCECIGLN